MQVFIETPNDDMERDVVEGERLSKLLAKHLIEWKFGDLAPGVVYDHRYLINKE
ncbi:hypothetical protein [Neobacillus vireti]|uniref:hypothetical protein n=1 Tax=Neobacillus vireti TaxID=220686 RepID=UPI002FFE034F